jgi:hypothetical protein
LHRIHAENIPPIAVEERRYPVVSDAVHMHRLLLLLLHHGTKLVEILVSRVLKIDRDVDIRHAKTAAEVEKVVDLIVG